MYSAVLAAQYRSLGAGEEAKGIGHNGNRYRYRFAQPVDTAGELPDGRTFEDIRVFKSLLEKELERIAQNWYNSFRSMELGPTSVSRIANKSKQSWQRLVQTIMACEA